MSELIRSERRDAIALLTLNRPDALNSLDREILGALGDAIAEVAADGSARVLVLTGEGRAFAAGADIAQMQSMTALDAEAFSRLGHRVFAALGPARGHSATRGRDGHHRRGRRRGRRGRRPGGGAPVRRRGPRRQDRPAAQGHGLQRSAVETGERDSVLAQDGGGRWLVRRSQTS